MKGIDTDLLERSSIKIRLDITNQHIAYTLQMRLVEAFQHFLEQLVRFSERNWWLENQEERVSFFSPR